MTANSSLPVQGSTSASRSAYPFALITASRSFLLEDLRPLNCETQNLVEAHLFSRYLHYAIVRRDVTRLGHREVGVRTSRRYGRMKLSSRFVSGVGENTDGFASAAVAIMTESAPVMARIRRASSKPIQSPFSMTATSRPRFLTKSTISLRREISARSRGRMLRVRQWMVRQLMPVLTIFSTRTSVSSCVGSKRIFADMEMRGGSSRRRAERMEHRRSGFVSRAAPMPAWVEKGLGQPQFNSIPETSSMTKRAACTARSGSAEPT